jgi:hypothetical protein
MRLVRILVSPDGLGSSRPDRVAPATGPRYSKKGKHMHTDKKQVRFVHISSTGNFLFALDYRGQVWMNEIRRVEGQFTHHAEKSSWICLQSPEHFTEQLKCVSDRQLIGEMLVNSSEPVTAET